MKTIKTITIDDETYELSDDFLSNVLQTAVEGACSYWADVDAEYAGDDTGPAGVRDFDLTDYTEGDDEDEDRDDGEDGEDALHYTSASFLASKDPAQGGTLDLEEIADAIERITSGEVEIAPAIREIIGTAVKDDDPSAIDAEAADCIVQIGLFDEVVFS